MNQLLKPFIKEVKSYPKDSTHFFFNKCQPDVCDNTKNITFDLVSLYTKIPHNLGIKAINHYLTNYEINLYFRLRKDLSLNQLNLY